MKKETIKSIFNFFENEENKTAPFMWKLKNEIPLTDEELNVKGNLNLSHSEIETLPKGLKVGGTLYLGNSKSLTSLPEGLEVGMHLDLTETNITSLPKGLKVGMSLYIDETPLAKFSDEELKEMVYPGFIKGKISRL